MWRRAALFIVVLGCSSCEPEPSLVVGRLGLPLAPAFCSDPTKTFTGPHGLGFCTYTEGEPVANVRTSEWVEPVSSSSAHFSAVSPDGAHVGVAFQLDSLGGVHSLTSSSILELDMDIEGGDPSTEFELFIGRGPGAGCYYKMSWSKSGRYVFDLSQATWCVPSQCNYDLQANGGLLIAKVSGDTSLRANVKSIAFKPSPVEARWASANALAAGNGPGGLCWYLINWGSGGNAKWQSQLGPGSAFVLATASANPSSNSVAGMAFELPQGTSAADYSRIDITASVNTDVSGYQILIQGVQDNRGRQWLSNLDTSTTSQTTVTMTVDLLSRPWGTFPSNLPELSNQEIHRFEIVTTPNAISQVLDINVTKVELRR